MKTNIGHLESAAGIAGSIKVALSLKHGIIPPQLHFQNWNPQIASELSALRVVTKSVAIPEHAFLGVSSFGFGGTNAHVIVGEAPSIKRLEKKSAREYSLFPISARSKTALNGQITAYKNHLLQHNDSFDALVDTAWKTRDHHDYRTLFIAKDRSEALDLLSLMENKENHPQIVPNPALKSSDVVFVFSEQGPKWSISKSLLQHEPIIRDTLIECEYLLGSYVSWSLTEEIVRPTPILDPIEAQPLYFSIQVALAKLWMGWGITPSVVVGHSLGEVATAHIAGALSLSEAMQVVIQRSKYAKKLAGKGKMLVVQLAESEQLSLYKNLLGK